MRRAVILATLTILLLAVAGVTAAREENFRPIRVNEDLRESTAPETTVPESTDIEDPDQEPVETTVPAPGVPGQMDPDAPAPERTLPVVRDPGEPEVGGGSDRPAGKPEKPGRVRGGKPGKWKGGGRPEDVGGPAYQGGPENIGKPEDAGNSRRKEPGGNPGKVTLCHKGKVTLSVGAPAETAHLRHGDSCGAC